MLKDKSLTYVTLFSSAGVGFHGFQMEVYHCIATNEIIERRMQVQRCNHKCEFDSGYIVGDITSDEIKQRIYDEIHRWEKKGNDRVDVIIATPPCQGISVINHKKNGKEINSHGVSENTLHYTRWTDCAHWRVCQGDSRKGLYHFRTNSELYELWLELFTDENIDDWCREGLSEQHHAV